MNLNQIRRVVVAVLSNRDLRRVEAGFAGFNVAESGGWIAMMVFAYGIGGTTAAGVMGALLLVPATFLAPVVSTFGDRFRRDHVLAAGYAALSVSMCLAGIVMLTGASLFVVYPFAAVSAAATAVPRPVQSAMLPNLAQTPDELTAANVLAGWIFGLGILFGPLLVAAILALSSPGAAFVILGIVSLGSCLAILGLTPQPPPAAARLGEEPGGVRGEILAGIRELASAPRQAIVVALLAANFVVDGAIDVLLVIVSVRFLHAGNSGVGLLMSAVGVGSLFGAAASLALVGRRQVKYPLLVGALAWGIGLGFIGVAPSVVIIPALVVVAGAGRPLMDISGRMLLQRVVPDAVLSRVFGVLEGLTEAAFGVGMLAVPVLFGVLSASVAFVAIGIFLPLLVLLGWRELRLLDASTCIPQAEIELLRGISLFAPLSPLIVERMAIRLAALEVPTGTVIIHEGDPGDRFYVIEEGEVEVRTGATQVARLGPTDFFGEIALLRDVKRTATVGAESNVRLLALERDDFLEAITGQPRSTQAADSITDQRLSELAALRIR